jgi:hypothetical protein
MQRVLLRNCRAFCRILHEFASRAGLVLHLGQYISAWLRSVSRLRQSLFKTPGRMLPRRLSLDYSDAPRKPEFPGITRFHIRPMRDLLLQRSK